MEEGSFGEIRRRFEDLEIDGINKLGSDWLVYRTDAMGYVRPKTKEGEASFYNNFPDAEESIREDFLKRHERGERVLVYDICGIADASSLGADHTACLAFKPPPEFDTKIQTRTIFEGDIFRKDSLKPLFDFSSQYGSRPSCIFFVPVGGLSAVPMPNAMQASLLAKQFTRLYDNLAPGGQMYLQIPPNLLFGMGATGVVKAGDVLREIVGSTGSVEQQDEFSPMIRIRKKEG